MTGPLRITPLTGAALAAALPDLAQLRISVFADWPYLYDGDADYEQRYLQTYLESPGALVVGAHQGPDLVGAATGAPLADHAGEFAAAFAGTGLDLDTVFYCAESVLLPAYRGQGAGHAFFDQREAHARALGFSKCCFCAVTRAPDHPARPAAYRPLDGFWRGRGYAPLSGVVAQFDWKDHDEDTQSTKPLQFWMRDL